MKSKLAFSATAILLSFTISPTFAGAPKDYFSEAIAVGPWHTLNNPVSPQADVSTGQIAGPEASIISPGTSVYIDGNGQYNNNGIGFLVSTGVAKADANRALGQLHVEAGATSETGHGTSGFAASANALFGDTLYFTSLTAQTTIGFTVHLDGTLSNVPGLGFTTSGTPSVSLLVLTAQNAVQYCPNGFCPTVSANVTAVDLVKNFRLGSTVDDPLTIDQSFHEMFTFTGLDATVPFLFELIAAGQHGLSQFSDTATVSFDPLPEGVSYTSASGDFLVGPSAIPEPST